MLNAGWKPGPALETVLMLRQLRRRREVVTKDATEKQKKISEQGINFH